MAALAHDLVALLRQRQAVDLDDVVEHAGEHPHDLAVLVPVERGLGRERRLDEPRQVHRPEQARTVRRQRLFAAVVGVQAVGVKRVDARHLDIVDRLEPVGRHGLYRCRVALAVQPAAVGRQRTRQPGTFPGIRETDEVGKAEEVVTGDDELVLGTRRVLAFPAIPVRQQGHGRLTAVPVDLRDDAQPQQHALRRFERRKIRLREAHRHALRLGALHGAVRVEQSAQQSAVEITRGPLGRRRDCLRALTDAERRGEVGNPCHAQPELAATGYLVPTGKISAAWESASRVQSGCHDATVAPWRAVGDGRLWPGRQHGALAGKGAVADEQPHEVALTEAMRTRPGRRCTVVVEQHAIASDQLVRGAPGGLDRESRLARHAPHAMIGGQAQ